MRNYIEEMQDINPEALLADGYDDCIIGIGYSFENNPIFVYDKYKMIDKMIEDGMEEGEAYEYFDYNILGAYLGEDMPIFVSS